MGLDRVVAKLTAPLARRVRLMARRAVVRLIYDDRKMQELQLAIFAGEVRDRVERWEDYGLTSHPHPGAEALVLALGGSTDHGAVVKVADRRYRLVALEQGEVALYDDQGQVVHLKRGKQIHVYGCDQLVADVAVHTTVNCPQVICSGNLHVAGNLSVGGSAAAQGAITSATSVADPTGTMQAMRTIYNGHTHPGGGTPTPGM